MGRGRKVGVLVLADRLGRSHSICSTLLRITEAVTGHYWNIVGLVHLANQIYKLIKSCYNILSKYKIIYTRLQELFDLFS